MIKKILTLIFILVLFSFTTKAQKVEPPFWWVGMQNDTLQLLIHYDKIALLNPRINSNNIKIIKVEKDSSENYLFVDLLISPQASAGKFDIDFYNEKKRILRYEYELKARRESSALREGISQKDIIYLLMPDRFSNGILANDNMEGMLEQADRNNPDGRHGGDIQGIINNFDYINKLGVTAIWINPLLENNMPNYSYHGYAITDYYQVDARFGSNQDYLDLVLKAKDKNIKIIMDMVFNHCGLNHWWMSDLPSPDWVHQQDKFTRSNYRAEALMDPYASERDKMLMSDGWFDHSMPDLNQKNPFLANYLIQNSIWWIEYADLDGIRMDTYPYSDQDFMRRWEKQIHQEYPNFQILGEAWLQYESQTAWFQNQSHANQSDLDYSIMVTDFPLAYAVNSAFNEEDGWTSGLSKLYYTLSKDFLYYDPNKLVIFTDNHDIDRFYTTQNEDFAKWKMGMTFLMTTRGIPMIYYGTEYIVPGKKHEGDAKLRKDFLGGWTGDSISAISQKGMDTLQIEAFNYLHNLIQLKKQNTALQTGKLTQYIPRHGYYVYFRTNDKQAFMIVLNNNDKEVDVELSNFTESLSPYTSIRKVGAEFYDKIPPKVQLSAKSAVIFQLK